MNTPWRVLRSVTVPAIGPAVAAAAVVVFLFCLTSFGVIVVLGGVNPNGGSGRLFGVVLAVLILQVLSSGLNMFPNVSNFYRPLIWGGVLLAVMVANYFSKDRPLLRRFPRRQKSR